MDAYALEGPYEEVRSRARVVRFRVLALVLWLLLCLVMLSDHLWRHADLSVRTTNWGGTPAIDWSP